MITMESVDIPRVLDDSSNIEEFLFSNKGKKVVVAKHLALYFGEN